MFYSLIVSAIYAFVYAAWPHVAEALLLVFVVALLLPACYVEGRRWRRGS